MLKNASSVVLALLGGLNVPETYASPPRSLRSCRRCFWTSHQEQSYDTE